MINNEKKNKGSKHENEQHKKKRTRASQNKQKKIEVIGIIYLSKVTLSKFSSLNARH